MTLLNWYVRVIVNMPEVGSSGQDAWVCVSGCVCACR